MNVVRDALLIFAVAVAAFASGGLVGLLSAPKLMPGCPCVKGCCDAKNSPGCR